MSFQWLQMRITEEKERREREAMITERLPLTLEELRGHLAECIENYTQAFGAYAADLNQQDAKLRVVVRAENAGKWEPQSVVEIGIVPELPGFRIEREGDPLLIEVGLLPGDRICYRDRELDQYLTTEELTRRILDRALFPKLKE